MNKEKIKITKEDIEEVIKQIEQNGCWSKTIEFRMGIYLNMLITPKLNQGYAVIVDCYVSIQVVVDTIPEAIQYVKVFEKSIYSIYDLIYQLNVQE